MVSSGNNEGGSDDHTVKVKRCKACGAINSFNGNYCSFCNSNIGFEIIVRNDSKRSAKEMKDAWYSAKMLRKLGYFAEELNDAGYSAKELKDAMCSAKELSDLVFLL